ncbi:tyrosine-type recombinase/integrase [Brevibacterium spongiae]|uniref:Site-specific integrase n=1 Tax=Brevibacterium spongiae TaxID=2909672 RepID=A0ABY5STI7_9MICO|nr:tyrosine-type recombinase/integrase [Brevibacterium spongiae]UVI36421.1 site-specific integrase [Brevibacterium spongiae]
MLAECSAWLAAQGYTPGTSAGILNLLGRLSLWMQQVGAEADDLSQELLDRFIVAERSRDFVCTTVKHSMSTMRRFLVDAGYLALIDAAVGPMTPAQAAVAQWASWMRDQRGLAEKTIAARCHYAAGLLDVIMVPDGNVEWGRLDAPVVNAYVAERGRGYGLVSRAHIVDAVRCLLRWALSTGHLDRDLAPGILKPPGTRHGLPRGVSAEQVTALLAVCDPATAIGARDRAVVMILVRLGLRAGEVARLSLDDIDWANGLLKVTGKGREHRLPIPIDVGQALEAWLRLRPVALDRAVFVRMKAPRGMMMTSAISGIVARLSGVAGIDPIYAHRLRHTAAMDVLATGGTLAEAKELLGHAYTVTTMAYAKVDLTSLRELVVPFGQVPR